jgi:hypothetical protein
MSTPRVIARLFAVLLTVLFVAVLPAVLLAYNATAVALSPRFLDAAVSDTRLYEAALAEAAADLAHNLPTRADTRDLPIARVDAQGWQRILTVVAPPASMQSWLNQLVAGFRGWRRGSDSLLSDVVVPFGDMRNNLVNDPAQTVLRTVTEAQPPCAAGEERLAGPGDLIPQCRPPAGELESFYAGLSARWQTDSQAVWQQLWPKDMFRYADNLTLGELIRRDAAQHTSWRDLRSAWSLAGWSMSLAQWFVILLIAGGAVVTLAIIAALAARNGGEVLRWVGGPILLAGVITFGAGLVMLVGGWTVQLWSDPAPLTAEMQAAARDVTRLFTNRVFVAMAWQGAVLAVGGLALWGSSFLMRRPRPQE